MADKDRFDEDSLYDKRKAFDNEEYAKELAADEYDTGRAADMAPDNRYLMSTRNRSIEAGAGVGWLAIVFSVIALFFLPIIMGVAGIIVGYMAYREGAKTLGAWAVGLGLAAIIIRFIAPLF